MKCTLIDHFYRKSNKIIERNKNTNTHDEFSEDTDIVCTKQDEELVKERKEEMENNILNKVDHKKGSKRHNKNGREEHREESENKV